MSEEQRSDKGHAKSISHEASDSQRGTATRLRDAREVYRRTRDPRAATLAYCRGNRWLMENARAVGNLPEGE